MRKWGQEQEEEGEDNEGGGPCIEIGVSDIDLVDETVG